MEYLEAQQHRVPSFRVLLSVGYAVDTKQDVMRLCLWPDLWRMSCTSVTVCVWNENICNLMKECNGAWKRGNGRGNAFRFTSGG